MPSALDFAAFREQVEHFCSLPDGDDHETLSAELIETRRLITLLELRFSRAAAAFAAVHHAQPERSDDGLDAVQWMREECRMTSHAASTAVTIGEEAAQLPLSCAAAADGRIGLAHLGWMALTSARMSTSPTAAFAFTETRLLGQAEKLSVQRFRRQCEKLIHAADREQFEKDEVDALDGRRLQLSSHEDGWITLAGTLDPEGGALLRSVLEPFSRREQVDDHRDLARRRADALVELCSHALDTGVAAGSRRPHLAVTTDLETLVGMAGADPGSLDNGALLSSTAVQRLACDATITRVLVSSDSAIIDLGRSQRVVNPSTRKALELRDKGCVWPGCERPASWTQAHHMVHWAHFGATDRSNLVLLCHRHHWMVHEGGWAVVRTDEGRILVFGPPWARLTGDRDPTAVASG